MRYKKGCKVEVRSYKTMLISWQCAEFISGSDHSCLVKFESKKEEAVFERVSWNDIRPCPPSSVEDIDLQFVSGDVLEVFDHGSWLTAVVLKVLNKGCYSVRLLGSSKELKIHKSRIRLRLSWQHEKWLSVGQGSRRNQHFKPNGVRNILKFKLRQIKKDFIPFEDNERYRRKVDDGDFYPKEKPGEKGGHAFCRLPLASNWYIPVFTSFFCSSIRILFPGVFANFELMTGRCEDFSYKVKLKDKEEEESSLKDRKMRLSLGLSGLGE
ncbi:uncharacterized protein LOC124928676 isoform X2 [Impatiens glandulifera]|uniref:uncharacterized protein LOC124928676 isoform X2 n=1 Tax=Impatiens glandulifera TaxID=253017 RepID=UPI001FB132BF|nr:uncharacterized protein LOC124928676 isoform X2 [Impatiens glandulifera]